MTKAELFCDHCGKKLDEMSDYPETNIECAHKWDTTDLCANCLDLLWKNIESFISNQKAGANNGK